MNINKMEKRTRDKSYLSKYMKIIFVYLLFGSFLWASAPTITLDTRNNPTNNARILVTVSLSENVTDFDIGDIVVDGGQAGFFTRTTDRRYAFLLTFNRQGTITVTIPSGSIHSSADNTPNVATSYNIIYDTTSPVKVDKAL